MKKIIQTHIDWILSGIGILIIAAIAWFLLWGVTTLAQDLGTSLGNPRSTDQGQKFNLSGASTLNFRGLKGQ